MLVLVAFIVRRTPGENNPINGRFGWASGKKLSKVARSGIYVNPFSVA